MTEKFEKVTLAKLDTFVKFASEKSSVWLKLAEEELENASKRDVLKYSVFGIKGPSGGVELCG